MREVQANDRIAFTQPTNTIFNAGNSTYHTHAPAHIKMHYLKIESWKTKRQLEYRNEAQI